jgi:hypothetical protein
MKRMSDKYDTMKEAMEAYQGTLKSGMSYGGMAKKKKMGMSEGGMVDMRKTGFDKVVDHIGTVLAEKYGVSGILKMMQSCSLF